MNATANPYRSPGRLWLSLYLPNLPLEALCRGGPIPRPAAVTEGRGARTWLVACEREALARGAYPGMALDAACALIPALRVLRRDARAERSALEGLALWAGGVTSCVSLMPPQGLLLEVGGSVRLFGGLERLGARVRAESRALGYRVHLAVAPTPLGAWLLARSGLEGCVTERSALAGRLAPVPVAALGLPEAIRKALTEMGLRTFGDCARLPRDGSVRRLGPELADMLDRALDRAPDPREPWTLPPSFERRLSLPAPVAEVEAVLFATHRLLLELAGFLTARAGGVQRLELELRRHDGACTPVSLDLVAPTRDVQHLLGLLRERLMRPESFAAGEAVEAIGLRAKEMMPLAPCNLELFGPVPAAGGNVPGAAWLERLQARLGVHAVRGLAAVPDHRPERAWRCCEPGETTPPAAMPPPRPLWLLPQPHPLRMVNGAPWLDGVLRLRPRPERIESGWWDGEEVARDYFVAQNPGGEIFWIYRERSREPRWFVHGVFG